MNLSQHISQIFADLNDALKKAGQALFDAKGRERRYRTRVVDEVIKKLGIDGKFATLPANHTMVAIGDSGELASGETAREALDSFRQQYGNTKVPTLFDPFEIHRF